MDVNSASAVRALRLLWRVVAINTFSFGGLRLRLIRPTALEALAKDKAYEFAFIVEPLKIKGGTGSTVAPIAVRWARLCVGRCS